MIRYGYILLFCLLFPLLSFAQKENNVWNFGYGHGLDFNGGDPVYLNMEGKAEESCASVSDPSGSLLFYTDGGGIYDRNNKLMPNGKGLSGDPSSTQGAAIASVQYSDSLYFVFTLSGAPGTLNYSVVDMSLNGGMGDVISGYKDLVLQNIFTEKLLIAGNCDKQWLILHHGDSAIFYAYPLGSSINIGPPVLSYTGDAYGLNTFFSGEMNCTRDFKTLGLVCSDPLKHLTYIHFFDFNSSTGVLSNYHILDSTFGKFHYGMEFSPDGSKLYVTDNGTYGMLQYDLSAGSPAAIRDSKYGLETDKMFYSIRMGPDDKLYAVVVYSAGIISLYRIKFPNRPKLACTPQKDYLSLPDKGILCNLGNYYVPRIQDWADTVRRHRTYTLCKGDSLEIGKAGYYHYNWNDDDTNAYRTVSSNNAEYILTATYACQVSIDTFSIIEKPIDSSWKKTDLTACFTTFIRVKPSQKYEQYKWSNGPLFDETYVTKPANYVSLLAARPSLCQVATEEFYVSFVDFSSALRDTFFCSAAGINLDATVAYPEARYLWSSGDTTPVVHISKGTTQYLTIDVKGCKLYDTVTITQKMLELNIGNDTTLCEITPITLHSDIAADQYTWTTGENTPSISVSSSGTYGLTVYKDGCQASAKATVLFDDCYHDCIKMPNAFSPNNDGRNDGIKPLFSCPVYHYQFKIVNRWGEVVFSTLDINQAWDGTFNGRESEAGVYYYFLKMTTRSRFQKETMVKGDLTLIR